jgi:hypothetical protein
MPSEFTGTGTADASTVTGATALTANEPAGAIEGDLLIAVFVRRVIFDNSGAPGNVTGPDGWANAGSRTQTAPGASSNTRVSVQAWSLQRTSASASASVSIAASAFTETSNQRLFVMGVRGPISTGSDTNQGDTSTGWPTSAQSLTADSETTGVLSIITNNGTTAQSLETANGFTRVNTGTTIPAHAVAFRSIADAGTYAVPIWTGTGGVRAMTSFLLQGTYEPPPTRRPRRGLGLVR